MNNIFSHKHWQVFRLNEICTTKCGVLALSHPYTPGEVSIPYIKPRDILFNTIVSANEYVSQDIIGQAGAEIVPKESILLAATGSNAGNIALLGKDAVVNQHVCYVTIKNSLVKSKYLYYYLYFKRNLLVTVSKYAVRGSQRSLQQLQIPLPSLKEQDEIVQYLDINFGEINTSIEQAKNSIHEISNTRKLILNKIFLQGMQEDSFTGWNILKLTDCGLVKAGLTPNGSIKEYYGAEYPLFKPNDFLQGMQLKYAETYLSFKGLKLVGLVKANSIIICSNGINFGNVRIIKVDGACSQQIISFTPYDKLLPEFVYFQMLADNFRHQLFEQSKNSAISISAFKNISVLVTDLDKQQAIVNKLYSEISLLEKRESDLNKKLVSLDEAKYKFLLRAFPANLFLRANIIALIFISCQLLQHF